MKLTYRSALVAGALLTATVAGCSTDNSASPATTPGHTLSSTSAATTTTAHAAAPAVNLTGPNAAALPSPSPTHPWTPAPAPLSDIDCGTITGSNGATANVIAFASAAGRTGCTEAITVTSDYVGAQHSGDSATVDGWTCEPQPDTTIPHICTNAALTIGLRGQAAPASPPPPAATAIRTVDANSTPRPVNSTEPAAPAPAETVEDVHCGPVTDTAGSTRQVIAVGGAAGRVGCTEAITVAAAYVTTIAPTDVATVDGWSCNAQPDAATPSVCAKDGLVIGLRAR
ncbi:hypothetical protein NOU13_31450 [Rhodococcus erythropolis]|uniref:hypothetical protein n=1 Tax=Rhodococcus erythropolis TaxID=1833 RepID=UPI002108BCCF|nr:hypothetical protein [Rhodococcus erythropolis]MCQ4129022.1 hypothetical protein [Rhodococcus erythropolis]